jgi:peptide-methionine (R)-S-oxide reductase
MARGRFIMSCHRIRLAAGATTVATVLALVSHAMAGQDAAQPQETPAAGQGASDPFQVAEKPATKATGKDQQPAAKNAAPEFVRKTDEEWARILPPAVFMVTRQKATEPAFSGRYATGHYRGTFICACCEADLFGAEHKFDSGTGWPSFWRPISDKALQSAIDNREAEQRIEVMCRRCGAHLGHVFNDNPAAPTGLRYCINSLALKLKTSKADASAKTSSARTKLKSGSRAKLKGQTVSPATSGKVTTPASGADSQAQREPKPDGS